MLKPASAPPSPSSTRASTPQASDVEDEDDTHLYDEDEDEENGAIEFKVPKSPDTAIPVEAKKA